MSVELAVVTQDNAHLLDAVSDGVFDEEAPERAVVYAWKLISGSVPE